MNQDELRELFERNKTAYYVYGEGTKWALSKETFIKLISSPAFIQATERKCEWTKIDSGDFAIAYITECGKPCIADIGAGENWEKAKYCWNCGGRIEIKKEKP